MPIKVFVGIKLYGENCRKICDKIRPYFALRKYLNSGL